MQTNKTKTKTKTTLTCDGDNQQLWDLDFAPALGAPCQGEALKIVTQQSTKQVVCSLSEILRNHLQTKSWQLVVGYVGVEKHQLVQRGVDLWGGLHAHGLWSIAGKCKGIRRRSKSALNRSSRQGCHS